MLLQIVPHRHAASASPSEIGPKAESLRNLANNGLNVPKTWVLPSNHFTVQHRAKQTEAALMSAQSKIFWNQLRLDIEEILRAESTLAIRSSASVEDGRTHSFAGIFTSFLSINTPDEALTAIQECWNSVDSPACSAYCHRIGFDPMQIEMAVIIQTMVVTLASGVLFNCDPISGDEACLVIEASRQPRAVVDAAGQVANYELSSRTGEILSSRSIEAASLTPQDTKWLWETAQRVSAQLGSRCEIEWAIGLDCQRYVLQARPVVAMQSSRTHSQ